MCFALRGKYCGITSTFPPVTHLHFFDVKNYLYVFQNIFCLYTVQFCPWYEQGKQLQQTDQQCSCFINDYVNDLPFSLCICSYTA